VGEIWGDIDMSIDFRAAGLAVALSMSGGVALADSVAPSTYSDTLEIGGSVTIRKTVTAEAGGPDSARVDVFFLADSTGSMGGQIAQAKANANTIISSLSGLGDVHFDVTFTGLEEGTHDFVIHALVDGGIVATETDRIVVGEGAEPGPGPGPGPGPAPISLPAGLPPLLGALDGLGLVTRRRRT
jgi:hypothetical protein